MNAIVQADSKAVTLWRPQRNNVYCMDALYLLRCMPDASVDCIITDPPYGIDRDKGAGKYNKSATLQRDYVGGWDSETPDRVVFDEMLRVSRKALIFGGNYFSDKLPQSNYWIVWDKLVTMPSYSKCELIWTNFEGNTVQKITRQMNGMIGGIRDRKHATQKPVDLIMNLILMYTKKGDLILDPFLGSGTTALACRNTGRDYIGCDISAEYVALARERLQNTDPYQATVLPDGRKQLSLFQQAG